jgi:hypothetical protein
MPDHDHPFDHWPGPGTKVTNLDTLIPMSARFIPSIWQNEVLLLALDEQWRSRPAVTLIHDAPSVPELLEQLFTWASPSGEVAPHLLDMTRVVCVSSHVPFRIGPDFDWFDCDDHAKNAGVHLVEWIALAPDATLLPREMAGVPSRWPVPAL